MQTRCWHLRRDAILWQSGHNPGCHCHDPLDLGGSLDGDLRGPRLGLHLCALGPLWGNLQHLPGHLLSDDSTGGDTASTWSFLTLGLLLHRTGTNARAWPAAARGI